MARKRYNLGLLRLVPLARLVPGRAWAARTPAWSGPALLTLAVLGCGGPGAANVPHARPTSAVPVRKSAGPAKVSHAPPEPAARDCKNTADDYRPYAYPKPVKVTIPAPPDLSGLPTDAAGRRVLIDTGAVELAVDTTYRGPSTALATCLEVIGQCWDDQHMTADNLVAVKDLCERSAPVCATQQPWNEAPCCPASCGERYKQLRIACKGTETAEKEVYFGDNPCIPGLREALHRH